MNRTLFYDVCLALITATVLIASFKGWGYL